MFNHNDILLMIKKAAMDIFISMKPTEICYGTVETVSPLTIRINQQLLLESIDLVLTRNVIDYDLEMTVEHTTEVADGHSHGYSGRKVFRVNNALIQGEKVILLRNQGGQKYLVLDKVVEA